MSDEATVEAVEEQPATEDPEAQPESAPASQAGAEDQTKAKGDSVPLARFLEERRARQEYQRKVAEYEAAQRQPPKDEGTKQNLDPDRKKAIRELVRESDPEAFETVEAIKAERQEREEWMLDEAEDVIRDLVKEAGFPAKNEQFVSRLGYHVMSEIREDPKLLRAWKAGNINVVKKAYDRYMTDFIGEVRKTTSGSATNGAIAKTVRAGARVPTPPPGGSGVGSSPPKRDKEDFGLTKKADDLAWEVFKQHQHS